MGEIKDSGNRTEFTTGAVRDCAEGKGRYDLLPLECVSDIFKESNDKRFSEEQRQRINDFLFNINEKYNYQITTFLARAIVNVCTLFFDNNIIKMVQEVAVHFEDGARKYGDRNWEKGIPPERYVDSALRHFFKHLNGEIDERHDRACAWNLICLLWTVKYKDMYENLKEGE